MTASSFDIAVNYVLANEGGLIDNPNDSGGITNFGISLRFLQNVEPERLKTYGLPTQIDREVINNLTLDMAKRIYRGEFWDASAFSSILSQNNCNYIFDCAVNIGIAPAIKIAQRACWAVMHKYRIIMDDGILGNESISMINQCGQYLLPAMCSERAGYYRLIAQEHVGDKEFIDGWMNRSYNIFRSTTK